MYIIIVFNTNLFLGEAGWVAPSAPPIPLDGYADIPPPSYEAAISADEGDLILANMHKIKYFLHQYYSSR